MRYQRLSNGQIVTLNPASVIGAGGEARIFAVPQSSVLAAKVYHRPTEEYGRKLRAMLANPPDDPAAAPGQLAIAWPVDLLHTPQKAREIVGFLMPRVAGMHPLFTFYNPSTRREICPLSNYLYLTRTARNLAAAVRALHNRGYVIGDVNESNILVTETALVTLVDTDSFQVRDTETGTVFRCPVGKIEFTPPELQGKTFVETDRIAAHDLFGLAVLIFQLLMEGTHPFAGVYQGAGEPPPYEARIQAGHFPHGFRTVPYKPMPAAPPFTLLHPDLQRLFVRCFETGHSDPAARPTAEEWRDTLIKAEESLLICSINAQHRYGSHLDACPWCARTTLLGGRDPFPSPGAVARQEHLVRRSRRPTLSETALATPVAVGSGGSWRGPAVSGGGTPVPSGPWSYSAPQTAPVFMFVPNRWGITALILAFVAIIPGVHILCGSLAILCGLRAVRQSFSPKGGERFTATLAIGFGFLMILAPFLLRPQRGLIRTSGRGVRSLAFSADSNLLGVGTRKAEDMSGVGGAVTLYDTDSEMEQRSLPSTRGDVVAVAFSPKGSYMAYASWGPLEPGDVTLWNTGIGREQWTVTAHRNTVQAVAFSPDGQTLATGGSWEYVRTKEVYAEIKLWDVRSGKLKNTLEGRGEVFALAFGTDGKTLAVGSGSSGSGASFRTGEAGRVSIYDVETGTIRWDKRAHSTGVLSVVFAPDGSMLASCGFDNAIRLWDAATGTPGKSLEGHGLRVAALAFAPDGQTLASGGETGVVSLWELATGKVKRELSGHDAEITALAYTPDGKILASGSRDTTVRMWRNEAVK